MHCVSRRPTAAPGSPAARSRARAGAVLATLVLALGVPSALPTSAAADEVLRGELREVVTDRFGAGKAESAWFVEQQDGRGEPFRPTDPMATLRGAAGQRVEVATDGSGGVPRGTLADVAPEAAAVEPPVRRVAVIPVESGLDGLPPSPERLATAWAQLPEYWAQQSFGRQPMRVDYLAPVSVASAPECNVFTVAADVRRAAASAGVDLSGYDHVVAVPEHNPACGSTGGMAVLPGRDVFVNGDQPLKVVVHELGHNRRLRHANVLECHVDFVAVAVGGTCRTDVYADPFDAMGNRTTALFQAFHRGVLGVYGEHPEQVRQVATDGTYVLGSVDSAGGTDLLTVDRPGSAADLTVELRAPSSVFSPFPAPHPAYEGVLLRLAEPGKDTLLLRAGWAAGLAITPEAEYGAPLPAGGEYADPSAGLRLRVDAVGNGSATVTVTYGTPDSSPPTAPVLTLTRSGDEVTARWSAATDDQDVAGYELLGLGGSPIRTTALEREATRTVELNGGWVDARVFALDRAGNRTASESVRLVLPDHVPPAPPEQFRHEFSTGNVRVRWTAGAFDGRSVTWDVTADGRPLRGGLDGSELDVPVTAAGRLTIGVTAVDGSGNRSAEVLHPVDVPDWVAPAGPTGPAQLPPSDPQPPSTTPATPALGIGPTPGPPGLPAAPGGTPPGPVRSAAPTSVSTLSRSGARFEFEPWSARSKQVRVRVSRSGWKVRQIRLWRNGRHVVRCRRATCAAATPVGTRTVRVEARLERPAVGRRPTSRRKVTVSLRVQDGRLLPG